MKTNKSYSKRLKVTKNGKIVARQAGQNHFNSRETRRKHMARQRTSLVNMSNKSKSRFLSGI